MLRTKDKFLMEYRELYKDLGRVRFMLSIIYGIAAIVALVALRASLGVSIIAGVLVTIALVLFTRNAYGLKDLRKFKSIVEDADEFELVETEHREDDILVVLKATLDKDYLLALRYEVDGLCSDATCIVK